MPTVIYVGRNDDPAPLAAYRQRALVSWQDADRRASIGRCPPDVSATSTANSHAPAAAAAKSAPRSLVRDVPDECIRDLLLLMNGSIVPQDTLVDQVQKKMIILLSHVLF